MLQVIIATNQNFFIQPFWISLDTLVTKKELLLVKVFVVSSLHFGPHPIESD